MASDQRVGGSTPSGRVLLRCVRAVENPLMNSFLNNRISFLSLILLSFFLYSNTLLNGFIWDDHYLVEENSRMKSFSSVPEFFIKDFWENSPLQFKSGFYRPLTLLAFFLNYQLWQGNPLGFHLFNIVLHGINGILVFLLLLRLTKKRAAAFLAAALFISHPIQTEVVSYIANINDTLAVFFLLLSLNFYCRFSEDGQRRYLVFSYISLGCGFLSKENTMVVTVLILLIDWFSLSQQKRDSFVSRIPAIVGYFFLTIFYIFLRIIILGKLNAITTLENIRYVSVLPSFGIWSHCLTVVKIFFLYLKLLVWPQALSVSYVMLPAIKLFSLDVFLAFVFIVSLGVIIFLSTIKNSFQWVTFSFLWFFITLFPLSNFIPISNTIAERFLYLPSIGYCFFLSNILLLIKERCSGSFLWRIIFYAGFVIITFLFSFKTVSRNRDWKSEFNLFSSAIAVTQPCSPIGHLNLSAYYYQKKNNEAGSKQYQAYLACAEFIQKQYRNLKAKAK